MKLLKLEKKEKSFLIIYGIVILAIYLTLIFKFGGMLTEAKESSGISHTNRMDATAASAEYPEGDYQEVKVGMYVDALRNISIADSSFEGVFYLWFQWEGDEALDPGSHFQFVGGQIDEKVLVSEHYDDGSNYQRYKVTASFDKYYNLTRVSLEDHMLNIYIEDTTRDGARLRYVTDEEQTNISSRVHIPGFEIYKDIEQVVKPHAYKSTYSSPNANGSNRVFSQYIVGISIKRDGVGFYLKILIPFLLSVALALNTLWSRPTDTDSRFGLAGAGFFGVVANTYVVNSAVPSNGGFFGLLDVLSSMSLMTVFLIVLTSILSLNIYDKYERTELALTLDKVAFSCILLGFAAFNVIIPFCAVLR